MRLAEFLMNIHRDCKRGRRFSRADFQLQRRLRTARSITTVQRALMDFNGECSVDLGHAYFAFTQRHSRWN